MSEAEIGKFLQANIEPIEHNYFGRFYRAEAYLKDGTYLPCVTFTNPNTYLNLAKKRFAETIKDEHQYNLVLESFVTSGNRLAIYDVASVKISPFAWSKELLQKIEGETTMGWTAFVVEMNDGKRFNYGTAFSTEFFDLPPFYEMDEIVNIFSGVVVDEKSELREFTDNDISIECFREKPFFKCYTYCLAD